MGNERFFFGFRKISNKIKKLLNIKISMGPVLFIKKLKIFPKIYNVINL